MMLYIVVAESENLETSKNILVLPHQSFGAINLWFEGLTVIVESTFLLLNSLETTPEDSFNTRMCIFMELNGFLHLVKDHSRSFDSA